MWAEEGSTGATRGRAASRAPHAGPRGGAVRCWAVLSPELLDAVGPGPAGVRAHRRSCWPAARPGCSNPGLTLHVPLAAVATAQARARADAASGRRDRTARLAPDISRRSRGARNEAPRAGEAEGALQRRAADLATLCGGRRGGGGEAGAAAGEKAEPGLPDVRVKPGTGATT